jgi:hypothetical protein
VSGHVGFVVDKVALSRFSPSTSVSPANFHSNNCSTITVLYHVGLVVGAVTSGLSVSPLRIKIKNNTCPLSLLSSGYPETPSSRVKQTERETDSSSQYNAEVKNVWRFAFISLYISVA